MNVTILGAAGFLGLNLVDELLAANIQPRCGRRTRTNVIPLRRRGVPLVHADLDDPATLRAAMADSDAVFHAAGHYPRHSLDPSGALDTALRQTRNLLDSAAEAGVGRLVYVSSTATAAPRTDGSPSNEADVFAAAPGFGRYGYTLSYAVVPEPAAGGGAGGRATIPATCKSAICSRYC